MYIVECSVYDVSIKFGRIGRRDGARMGERREEGMELKMDERRGCGRRDIIILM